MTAPPAAVPPPDPAASLTRFMRAEQLRLYQANRRTVLPVNLLVALVVAAVLWRHVAWLALVSWLAAMGLALLLRAWPVPPALLAGDGDAGSAAALRHIRFGAWAVALAWGLCGLLVPLGDPMGLVFLVIVLVGLTAGTVMLAGFDPHNTIGFALLSFGPLTLRLALDHQAQSQTLAALVTVHLVMTGLMALRAGESFKASMLLRSREAERLAVLARNEERLQQLTAALRSQTDALQLTLDTMDQGLLGAGPDGRVQVYNRRLSELTGLPEAFLASGPTIREAAAFQADHGLLGPDLALVPEAVRDGFAAVLQGEPASALPERYLRATLQGLVLEVKTRRLPDGAVVRTFTDVTAFVQAQDQLRASEAEARKLALVAAHTDSGVAILDAGRAIEWVNQSFERLSGWPSALVLGRKPSELLTGPQTDQAVIARLARDLAERGWGECELQISPRAGPPLWVAVEMRAVRGTDGTVSQYLLVGRSIQDRRDAEAALHAARDEALRASGAKTEFLSSMSHELRTPLNAILGFAALLDRQADALPDERGRRYLGEIRAAGEHLLALINDVLDLARVEAGAIALRAEPVLLRPVADECLRLLRPVAEGQEVRLPDTAVLSPFTVQADRRRLKQVLLNLLSNAVRYNRQGGQVTLCATADGPLLRLTIADQGAGIAAADQARLFIPFERLDAERQGVEGVGVGLALSRQLVERMGGRIGVDSGPGEGSRFWFTVPLAQAMPAEPPRPPLPGRLPPGPHAGLWRLLYIEDNPVNAVLMEAMLAHEPTVQLRVALLPEEGLAQACQSPPDGLLLDIQLPGIDGYEVLRRLRADPATAAVPVIAISANAMPDDIARGLAAGFDDYLAKPLDWSALMAALHRLLATGRQG